MRLIHTEKLENFLNREKRYSSQYYDIGNAYTYLCKSASSPVITYALSGELYLSNSGWLLLSVPNSLVRGAFDALNEQGIELPTKDGRLNAHITVMKPEDITAIGGADKISERGHHFHYTFGPIKEVVPDSWEDVAKVWLIEVKSPELQNLRKSYGLTSLPNNDKHEFHITIAIRKKSVLRNNDIKKTAFFIPLLAGASYLRQKQILDELKKDPVEEIYKDDTDIEKIRNLPVELFSKKKKRRRPQTLNSLTKLSEELPKRKRAIIIKGNPKFTLDSNEAENFYNNIANHLGSRGYDISFDPGEPHTVPDETADLWIGHSRGADRLRFAKPTTATFDTSPYEHEKARIHALEQLQLAKALGFNSINELPDNLRTTPPVEHYMFTPEMRDALDEKIGYKNNSAVLSAVIKRLEDEKKQNNVNLTIPLAAGAGLTGLGALALLAKEGKYEKENRKSEKCKIEEMRKMQKEASTDYTCDPAHLASIYAYYGTEKRGINEEEQTKEVEGNPDQSMDGKQRIRVVLPGSGGRYLLQRSLSNPSSFRLPGGGIEKGEIPEEAAKREIMEEFGIGTGKRLKYLNQIKDNHYFFLPGHKLEEGIYTASNDPKEKIDAKWRYPTRKTYKGPNLKKLLKKAEVGNDKFEFSDIYQVPKELAVKGTKKVKQVTKATYVKLEKRYGPTMAKLIIGAGLVGAPIPGPGTAFITASPFLAAGELRHAYKGDYYENPTLEQKKQEEEQKKKFKRILKAMSIPVIGGGTVGTMLATNTQSKVPQQVTKFPTKNKAEVIRGRISPNAPASILEDSGNAYVYVGPEDFSRIHARVNDISSLGDIVKSKLAPGQKLEKLDIQGHGDYSAQAVGDSIIGDNKLDINKSISPKTVEKTIQELNKLPWAENDPTLTLYGCNTGLCYPPPTDKPQFDWLKYITDKTNANITTLAPRGFTTFNTGTGLNQDVHSTARGELPQHLGDNRSIPGEDWSWSKYTKGKPTEKVIAQDMNTRSKQTFGPSLPSNKLFDLLYRAGKPSAILGALATPLLSDKGTAKNTAIATTALAAPQAISEIIIRANQAKADKELGADKSTIGTLAKSIPHVLLASLPAVSYLTAKGLGRWKSNKETKDRTHKSTIGALGGLGTGMTAGSLAGPGGAIAGGLLGTLLGDRFGQFMHYKQRKKNDK